MLFSLSLFLFHHNSGVYVVLAQRFSSIAFANSHSFILSLSLSVSRSLRIILQTLLQTEIFRFRVFCVCVCVLVHDIFVCSAFCSPMNTKKMILFSPWFVPFRTPSHLLFFTSVYQFYCGKYVKFRHTVCSSFWYCVNFAKLIENWFSHTHTLHFRSAAVLIARPDIVERFFWIDTIIIQFQVIFLSMVFSFMANHIVIRPFKRTLIGHTIKMAWYINFVSVHSSAN